MKRALGILAVVAMTMGLLATTTTDQTQVQEVITCDDCDHEKDDRGDSVIKNEFAQCDDCDHEKDDREDSAFLNAIACDDCDHEKDDRGDA